MQPSPDVPILDRLRQLLRCDKTGDAHARDAQWRALLAVARDRLQAVAP